MPPDWQLSPAEQKAVIKAFENIDETQANGVRLAGQKFFTLQCGPERIYGKKQASITEIRITDFDLSLYGVASGRWLCLGQDKAGYPGHRVHCTDPSGRSHSRCRGSSRLSEERELLDVIARLVRV